MIGDVALHSVAENDDVNDPQAKVTLREAYAAANIPAEIEVYEDAMHGWCAIDSQVYHQAQAERAWSRLLNLFSENFAWPDLAAKKRSHLSGSFFMSLIFAGLV